MPAVSLSVKAKEAGLELITVHDRVEARQGNKVIAWHTTAERALSKALERIEADRLRALPYDQEVVIRPRVRANGRPGPVLVSPAPIVVAPVADPMPDPPEALVVSTVVPDDTAPTRQIKGSIIKNKYKTKYKANGGSCGDEVAEELTAYVVVMDRGKARTDLKRLRQVAEDNGIWKDTYINLNPGQLRMTIGNRLRVKRTAGDAIDIGGAIFQIKWE